MAVNWFGSLHPGGHGQRIASLWSLWRPRRKSFDACVVSSDIASAAYKYASLPKRKVTILTVKNWQPARLLIIRYVRTSVSMSAAGVYCREVPTRKTMKNQGFCLIFDEKIMVWGGFSSLQREIYHYICFPGLGTLFMII